MPLRFRLEDLSPVQQEQVRRQLSPTPETKAGSSDNARTRKTAAKRTPCVKLSDPAPSSDFSGLDYSPKSVERPPMKSSHSDPNRTEAEFNEKFLAGKGRYEAISFRLPGGSLYTPDWFYFDDGIPTFVECKGSFAFASQSRSATAFRETVAAFPFWNFVWATKKKGGVWDIKKISRKQDNSNHE